MASLTRVEASERARLLEVHQYAIHLDLGTAGEPTFSSRTTIRFTCHAPGSATFVDLAPERVRSAVLNGRQLDLSVVDRRMQLAGLQADNELIVDADMSYSSDGEGLHHHVDPADGRTYLYAMSFLDAAPRWFACFDQPDLKAVYDLEVTCPPDWTVLGNGAATEEAPGRWRLARTQPLSTYLVTVVAGPYHSVRSEHDGIPLGLHARASLAEHLDREADEMLEVTRNALDRYHELFGIRYPFGEYHQAFVPDFNAGAMENPGCVTFRDQFVFRAAVSKGERGVRANVIAHEMAHMWFGNLVTMRWWDDLWLNESFAEYMAHHVCAEISDFDSWTAFGVLRKDWGYVADQAPSTHPIAANGSVDAKSALADFDGISYAKGAAALRQLADYLGPEVFYAGLRDHFSRHGFGNAELADLLDAWHAAGATNIADWSTAWLGTCGLDTLVGRPTDSNLVMLTREVPAGSGSELRRPHAVRIRGYSPSGRLLVDEPTILTGDRLAIPVSELPLLVVADGRDQTWAKVRFGSGDWSAVREVLPRIDDPAGRVVVYNAVRDAVRDGDLPPLKAWLILHDALVVESQDLAIGSLFAFATNQLAGNYSPVSMRSSRREAIAELALRLVDEADSGSDRQLVTARALVASTSQASLLRRWIAQRQLPDGLRMDPELRWLTVERLAALGEFDEHDVAAELANDRSAAGVVHAARAAALIPTAEAKQRAWHLLTQPSSLPAYELYATAEGFFEPSQTKVTADYAQRFFADMPATSNHRFGYALAHIALAAYPTSHPDERLLELADGVLSTADVDSGLRRSLVDGTDALRRALASIGRYH